MKNLIKKIKAIPNTIWDFILNILAVGLQWVTIVIMFPFKLLNKAWIRTVRFTGRCFINIADFLEYLGNIFKTIFFATWVIIILCLALALLMLIVPALIWLFGGTVFGIGWLLMLAGTFMMAHLIATGIIILLIIVIAILLVFCQDHLIPIIVNQIKE